MSSETMDTGWFASDAAKKGDTRACNCIGPRNGEPLCRCMMASLIKVPGLGLVKVIVPEDPRASSGPGEAL